MTKIDIGMWLFLEYLDGNLLRIHRRIMSRDQSKVGHEVFYSRNPLACAELNFEIRQSTIYYAWSLGRWDQRIVDQASDVLSIIFFRFFIDLGQSKLFTFIFVFF